MFDKDSRERQLEDNWDDVEPAPNFCGGMGTQVELRTNSASKDKTLPDDGQYI